jgi:lipopolysaccharide/colanic/teichoic acid biosynthesis glycosyltransferase
MESFFLLQINVAKMAIIHTMLKKWLSSSYKYLPKSGYKHKMKHTCLIINALNQLLLLLLIFTPFSILMIETLKSLHFLCFFLNTKFGKLHQHKKCLESFYVL